MSKEGSAKKRRKIVVIAFIAKFMRGQRLNVDCVSVLKGRQKPTTKKNTGWQKKFVMFLRICLLKKGNGENNEQ